MRLTLRTMLAYLDDILEPEDAREIGKKIEESEFATNLLHRARDVMRRLRLAAPNVNDPGPGLDPNTVAEYLDNTLPGDRVPDFEKICLESDIHLAEVASCHQILTLVLGEPVEIDPTSRQRMYQLPELMAAQAQPAAEAPSAATRVDEDEAKHRSSKPPVPDYLRDPPKSRPRLPIAATVALAVVLLIVLLAALGQFEAGSAMAKMLGIKGSAPQVARVEQPVAPGRDRLSDSTGPQSKPANLSPTDSSTKPGISIPLVPAPPASVPATPPSATPAAPTKSVLPASPETAPPLPRSEEILRKPTVAPKPVADRSSAAKADAKAVPPSPPLVPPPPVPGLMPPVPPATAEAGPGPGNLPLETGSNAVLKSPRPVRTEESATDLAPMPPERLGNYVADKQVFLQFDSLAGAWRRVPVQGVLVSGQPLLVLPAYQAVLALSIGTTINLLGGTETELGTEIELLPRDTRGVPGMNVYFGRLILRPLAGAKPQLRFQIGRRQGLLTFKNSDSAVAINVWRVRDPGVNPELQPGPLTASLYALTGEVTWDEGAGQPPVSVPAPTKITLDNQPVTPVAIKDLPKWVTNDEPSYLDRKAAPVLEQAIQSDRPVALTLRELVDHRLKEVGWLAIRSLGYIGQFEPMVAVLNMPEQARFWDDYIMQLQMALDRGPETAARVRLALEKRYPQDPGALYRMLWGYDAKDLQNGQAAGLVDYLDHDWLAFRVLSFYDIKKLLNGTRYFYQPDYPASKRQAAINKFRDRLQTSSAQPKLDGTKTNP